MKGFPLEDAEVAEYTGKSPAVGTILDSAELKGIAKDYAEEDEWAQKAQRRFSRVSTRLDISVLLTAIIGSLILAIGLLDPWFKARQFTSLSETVPTVLLALGIFGLLVGGYSAARLYELNAGDLAGTWMKSRARAE